MTERNNLIINSGLILIVTLVLSGLQSTLWPLLFSIRSSPSIWFIPLVHICLHRPVGHAVTYGYLSTLVLHGFTSAPLGILLGLHMTVLLACLFLRSRIYLPTLAYFATVVLGILVLENLAFIGLSLLSEPLPIKMPIWTEFLSSLILSPILASALFPVFHFIDRKFPVSSWGVAEA